MADRICSQPGCERVAESRGLCHKHYQAARYHGTKNDHPLIPKRTARDIVAERTEVTEAGCWQWTGHRDHAGYGVWPTSRPGSRFAHRVVYEELVGPIPEGLTIDHLCRNRGCVNPAHLEPVTQRENNLRGQTVAAMHASKTHCVHGHEFTPENTRIDTRGWRACRTCVRIRSAASWKRRKQRQT